MAGFPWPLGGVQDWFEGLWNWVSTAAVSAVSIVSEWITSGLETLWTWINEGLGALWTAIIGHFSFFTYWLARALGKTPEEAEYYREHWDRALLLPFEWIWTTISDGLSGLWATVSGGLGSLWTSITSAFSGALSSILGWLTNVYEALSGAVGKVGNTLMSGITSITDWVSTGLGDLWAGFTEWGSNALGAVTTMFDGAVAGIGKWVSDALAGVAAALGTGLNIFVAWIIEKLEWVCTAVVNAATWLYTTIVVPIKSLLRTIVAGLLEALMPHSPDPEMKEIADQIPKQYMARLQELIPPKSSPLPSLPVLVGAATGVVSLGILVQMGTEAFGAAFDQVHPVKNMQMWNTSADLINSFQLPAMIGPLMASPVWPGIIIPLRYRMNELFPNVIPPIRDLIEFTVHEVITPTEFYANAVFHGFSTYWSAAYWENHWRLPGFGNVVDAFHRGKISAAERDKYFVLLDYRPDKRPGIAISDVTLMGGIVKRLIPRVDLRYAWEMGKLTDEELEARYISLGYEEDAALMTEIQMARALVEEVHKVRDEWIRDFLEGYILEGTLRANLAAIGIGPLRIDYYVEYARMRREREYKADLLDAYWDGFLKDLVTYEELVRHAGEIIVDEPARDLWLEKAFIRKYKKPKVD